jgi:hypothetical protein
MKQIILCIALAYIIISVKAQSSVSIKNTSQFPVDNRWDLNNYLWSHIPCSSRDKPILDFNAIENWRIMGGEVSISCDGKYFSHVIKRKTKGTWLIDSLIIQSTTGSWKKCFAGANPGFFSGDGRQYIFQDKEILSFLKTGDKDPRMVSGIVSYKKPLTQKPNWIAYGLKDNTVVLQNLLDGKERSFKDVSNFNFEGDGSMFVYRLNNPQQELVIYDVTSGKESTYSNVKNYKFDAAGKALVLYLTTALGVELQYESTPGGLKSTIWSITDTTVNIPNYNFDSKGAQVIFNVQENRKNLNSIWYWHVGMDRAVEKVNNQTKGIDEGMVIKGAPTFTENGRYVRFILEKKPIELRKQLDAVQVDVRSYFDKEIKFPQSDNIANQKNPISSDLGTEKYLSFISVEGGPIIREKENERMTVYQRQVTSDFIVLTKSGKKMKGDRFWEKGYYTDSNWLVSLKSGFRKLLPSSTNLLPFWFLPKCNYLVYFDQDNGGNYFSYNLGTGIQINISIGVPKGLLRNEWNNGWPVKGTENQPFRLAFWQENLDRLYVYDKFDIWQLDLTGKKPAVNLTHSYGRSHHIIFRLMGSGIFESVIDPIRQGNSILLKAFNEDNNDNGFYRLTPGKLPELLYMGPCVMEKFLGNGSGGMVPIKAADTDVWIIKKQSATEAPNYLLTSDFKNYKPLTDLQPQKKNIWLTTELHSFKQLDGTISKGVLYKPENFDPSKKYPVIIAFYTKLSDYLYFHPKPEFMAAPVTPTYSPCWLVSHGYLVFLPDIDFSKGYWGPNTVNSIEGAARYLSTLSFVDGQHIGATGHSNSGRFGYYLLTHSKFFAAMSIGSGMGGTDIMSLSLSGTSEESALEWAEVGSFGKGLGNLWQNKQVWLDHTAILNVDKVVSPLLLFHNKNDGDDVRLAVELFTAMRRLEKKIWWLQYDEGGHGVDVPRDERDFTIRYTQFFDHYLKEAPAPRWMTQSIPPGLKAVESRYELDPVSSCSKLGKECPICKKWNEQYKKHPEMFEKPISEWHLNVH